MSFYLKAAAGCALALTLAACRGSSSGDATPPVPPIPGLYTGQLPDGRDVHVVLTADLVAWGAASRMSNGEATVFRTAYTFDGSHIQAQADQLQGIPALPSGTSLSIAGTYGPDQIHGSLTVLSGGETQTMPFTLARVPAAPLSLGLANNVSPLDAYVSGTDGQTVLSTHLMFQVDGTTGQVNNGAASPAAAGGSTSVLHGMFTSRNDCAAYNFNFSVGDPAAPGSSVLEGSAFQALVIPFGASGYVGFGLAANAQQAQKVVLLRKLN
ncbi:MAG TPA: hypothetical protein VK188_07245 [Holophaga sp.]|nr:hypothetical protein [Holophaga sp.]